MENLTTISLLLFFYAFNTLGQEEFSFQLNFEDSQGNKDSVIVGYDDSASDGIDFTFGEQNIISQSWDTILDVRLSEQLSYQNSLAPMPPPSFHTKKQVVEKTCNNIFEFNVTLNLVATYYPIEVSWDSTLFVSAIDTCHTGSLFTTYDYYQNDVGSGYAFFANKNSLMLYDDPGYPFYIDDTINVNLHWISFSKEQVMSIEEEINFKGDEDFIIYPNPTQSYVNIISNNKIPLKNVRLTLTDPIGVVLRDEPLNSSKIDLSEFGKGIYLIQLIYAKQVKSFKLKIN